jgi:hypothetical protein
MSLEAIALGLLALAAGLAFTFGGFRFFLILLPIWGFFAGFLFGANAITLLFGDGFLATTTSWIVGFVVALLFAALSYLYYWFAVIWLGASAGYAAGIGVMTWLGIGDGFLAFIVGLVVAAAFALAFIVLRVPKYLVLIATAFGGAFAAVTGVALILGRVPLADLAGGTVASFVRDDLSWIWMLAAVVLGAAGFLYQWMATARIEMANYEDYRNPGM